MSEANGKLAGVKPPEKPDRDKIRDLRVRNRLLAEQVRNRRLEFLDKRSERRSLLEASLAYDWVQPYTDLLDRLRRGEPELAGPTATWNRKWGRNYPIFQSEQELNLLRAPARVLCSTNEYAIGLLGGIIDYTVNTGFTYRAAAKGGQADRADPNVELLSKACQQLIDEFLERTEWQGGEQPGIEEEFVWRASEDGESILCHFLDTASGRTDVRVAEPEQMTMPPGQDPREWSFGVRTDPLDVQCPEGYWIQWGDTPEDGEEYTRDEVTHFRRNVKRSIKRGLTDFSFDTLDAFTLASHLRTNLGDAGAQQAAIVGITQYETGTKAEIEKAYDDDAEFQEQDPLTQKAWPVRRTRRGEWQGIPKGQAYVPPPTAQNSPIHLQILQALLRSAGRRWRAPEGFTSGDWSNNNFASALISNDPFVIATKRYQGSISRAFRRTMWVVIDNWCDVHGGVQAGGRQYTKAEIHTLIDILVEGQSPEVQKKLEDSQRAAIEIPLGVDSRQRYAQAQGRDWEQIQADNEDYVAQTGGGGQPLPIPGPDGDRPRFEGLFECQGEDCDGMCQRPLKECGGKGGKPGPCPETRDQIKIRKQKRKKEKQARRDHRRQMAAEEKARQKAERVAKIKAAAKGAVEYVKASALGAAVSHLEDVSVRGVEKFTGTLDQMLGSTMISANDALGHELGVPSTMVMSAASFVISRVIARFRKKQ